MLDNLRRYIRERRTVEMLAVPTESPHDEIQLAATALLLELAYADGDFAPPERAHIESALGRHFNLTQAGVQGLMEVAEREWKHSIDHFQFTRLICEHLDVGQRVVLAEVMWGVILADGLLNDRETVMLRKLASLLDVAPGYLNTARARAAAAPPAKP